MDRFELIICGESMLQKNKYFKYILLIVAAFATLAFASRSSFLYPFNNWDDANSYFSVGKGIFNGKMPYRDIFDQNGMYLYFLYGLAYLVSHTTFSGVYLLEVLLGTADIFLIYRILRVYCGRKISLTLSVIVFAAIVCSKSFWWGGAAEEICLPFLFGGLYLYTDYFINKYSDETMSYGRVFIGGLLAGVIANIKFTGLGFYFAWMMMVFFAFLAHKDIWGGIKACVIFHIGMFVPFIPWIIYFGVQGGLYEWYWGYVYVNVFVYNKMGTESITLFQKINRMAKILFWLIRDNFQYYIMMVPGLFCTLVDRKAKGTLAKISLAVLFAFTFVGIYAGGRELPYYALPLSVFAVFGAMLFGRIADKAVTEDTGDFGYFGLPAMAIMVSLIMISTLSMNIPFMAVEQEDFFLYRFRDEVLETENPTLLNVGCLDAGLYTLCDIVPTCRWFQTQTLDIDDPANNPYMEQERYVREGLVDYVLVQDAIPDSIDDHYELIDSQDYCWDNYDFMYYLYKKVK